MPTLFTFTTPEQKLKLQAKVASHERTVQQRRILVSQQVTTEKKGPRAGNASDLDSMDVKAVIKEAMILMLDTIERREDQNWKQLNADNLEEARRKL